MNVNLILLESVEGLGRPGDQVKVKPGFARNFLLPQRKAVVLTDDSMRMLGKLKAKAEAEERALISSMEELASKIGGAEVSVDARATEEGHLFGSVTEKDIHVALTAAGWEITQRVVRLPAHIKESGVHDVTLHLYGEITAEIKVEVVPVDGEGNRIEPMEPEEEAAPEGAAAEGGEEASAPASVGEGGEVTSEGGDQPATTTAEA